MPTNSQFAGNGLTGTKSDAMTVNGWLSRDTAKWLSIDVYSTRKHVSDAHSIDGRTNVDDADPVTALRMLAVSDACAGSIAA